ncbi:PAS domain S-box protein [soil metagenome]
MPGLTDLELNRMFDRSPVGMYRSNQDGTFIYANAALATLLGYSIPELLELELDDVYVDLEMRRVLLEKFVTQRMVDRIELDWRRKDGSVVTVEVWGNVVDHEGGWSCDASVLDVTEVKHQREELERTKRTLELVVDQMPAMYWVVDANLNITRAGGAIEKIIGAVPGMYGETPSIVQIQAVDPGTTDPVPYHLRALAGETCTYDTSFHNRHLAVTVAPYRQADGTLLGAIGTLNDVTAARTFERRLVDAQRAESLGVLAGGLAHDFNNLLVAILGNADLALRELPRGMPGRAAVENVRDAGLRAAELTHQLLTFSGKAGAGTTRVSPAKVVEELLRILGPSLPSTIAIAAEIPADLQLRADPGQLRQVLLNLITNARDAVVGTGGSITLRGSLVEHDGAGTSTDVILAAPGTYVLLEVIDDGAGMTDETRRHVFEPFFTTKDDGHGIGLAAVLGIVRAHQGGLRLCTKSGVGATFQVLWPAAVAVPGRAPTPPPSPATRVVLVIDDEDLVRDVVARMIEDLGYGTLTAADGAAGIALADANPIDAVLVDLSMPRMNGREVIARLRKNRPTLPIIVCSGFDRDGQGPSLADAYLPKPFRIDVLERTLLKLLGD